MKFLSAVNFIIFFSLANSIYADALPMNPGLWEYTTTSTNSLTGTQTTKSQECVTDNEFDPGSMMGGQDCNTADSTLSGDTLTFAMECNIQGGQAELSGIYKIKDDIGSGSMKMKMSFNGQTMTMESTLAAKRVGNC